MASMNKQWQKVQRSDRVQEHFMIGEFIQSDNWVSSSPPYFVPNNYPYLSDCIEFCGKEYGLDIKNEIRVTEITHATSCRKMLSIIKDRGFRPASKHIPGIGYMDLVWFGLKIEETEIDRVKDNYQRIAQHLLQYGLSTSTDGNIVSHFASTAPFQSMQCGLPTTADGNVVSHFASTAPFQSMQCGLPTSADGNVVSHFASTDPFQSMQCGLPTSADGNVVSHFASTAPFQSMQCGLPTSADGNVVSHFASTAPFQPMSRYGNFKFTLDIRQVLYEYKMQFGNGRLEMRKLGTFAYKMETMHVILVCQPGANIAGQCPDLVGDPVMQPDESFETWTWRPHSTGDQRVPIKPFVSPFGYEKRLFKRWEHVVFAFYVPMGRCLQIANLNDHVSLCLWQDMNRDIYGVNAAIKTMLELIRHEKQFIREELAKMLIRMIHVYIAEMHLYEKTISDFDPKNLLFDQECVDQKLKELLQMENTSFD